MRSISVEGQLVVWESEGGFGSDTIEIDGDESLSEVIARLFGIELDGRGSLGDREFGRVRLTIERLDGDGASDAPPARDP